MSFTASSSPFSSTSGASSSAAKYVSVAFIPVSPDAAAAYTPRELLLSTPRGGARSSGGGAGGGGVVLTPRNVRLKQDGRTLSLGDSDHTVTSLGSSTQYSSSRDVTPTPRGLGGGRGEVGARKLSLYDVLFTPRRGDSRRGSRA